MTKTRTESWFYLILWGYWTILELLYIKFDVKLNFIIRQMPNNAVKK